MSMFRLVLSLLSLALLGSFLEGGDLVEGFGESGGVNWTAFVVHARGRGNVNPSLPASVREKSAFDAAMKDAVVSTLQILNGLRVDSDLTVAEYLVSNDSLHIEATEIVSRHVSVVDRAYLSDGSVELNVEFSLLPSFLELFLPGEAGELKTESAGAEKRITGFVLDARGLEVNPSLLPRVVDEEGIPVYAASFVARKEALKNGVCGWAIDSIDTGDARIGEHPSVLKPTGVAGSNGTDLVVSREDAHVLHSSREGVAALRKCKLTILLD
jgi:hypothetical protein